MASAIKKGLVVHVESRTPYMVLATSEQGKIKIDGVWHPGYHYATLSGDAYYSRTAEDFEAHFSTCPDLLASILTHPLFISESVLPFHQGV